MPPKTKPEEYLGQLANMLSWWGRHDEQWCVEALAEFCRHHGCKDYADVQLSESVTIWLPISCDMGMNLLVNSIVAIEHAEAADNATRKPEWQVHSRVLMRDGKQYLSPNTVHTILSEVIKAAYYAGRADALERAAAAVHHLE